VLIYISSWGKVMEEQMSRSQYVGALAVIAVAAFMGGIVAVRVMDGTACHAQGASKVIEATEFRLVDAKGQTVGTFMADTDGPLLALYDNSPKQKHRPRLCLGANREATTVGLYGGSGEDGRPSLNLSATENTCSIFIMEKGGKQKIVAH
jgi:predicted lipoprotein with Yx(FWY)xxD motif